VTTPLVSVIVPVYNVEPFVRECLDTIVGQTLREIEILCVNDCSTDDSRSIVQEFEGGDPRIRLIDLPRNEGLSAARNAGMNEARGEFIAFVDSDDLIDPRLCELAYGAAASSAADLVIFDFAGFTTIGDLAVARERPSDLVKVDPGDTEALLSWKAYAWTKLLRTTHARTLDLQFPVGLTYEDILFHWEVLTQTPRRALLPERLCYYRQRLGSVGSQTDMRRADYLRVYDRVEAHLRSRGLYEAYGRAFQRKRLGAFRELYDTIDPRHRAEVRGMILDRMNEESWPIAVDPREVGPRTSQFFRALRGDWTAIAGRGVWLAARGAWRRCATSRTTGRRK
jgi:glycosyltransferase involved in cell wall biosynthesis